MSDLPVVCIFGVDKVDLKSEPVFPFETRGMDCRCYKDDSDLKAVVARDRPVAILSVGNRDKFPSLAVAPYRVGRMWEHFGSVEELEKMGPKVFGNFIDRALGEDRRPLISVFTPTYRTGDRIFRPAASLMAQKYDNWEWVAFDDSGDEGKTFEMLSGMAEKESRMRVYRESRNSGRIGNVKRSACGLCRGKYLVELDHDDELTPDALDLVVRAFERHPEAGFVYTDCAECLEDGAPIQYNPGWGMGYGSYRDEVIGGVKYKVINSPNINAKTIRHIVAAPNHVRAWRKSFYDSIGGHRDEVHVADDYELMVRTFLATRMVRVPKMCYLQYRNAEGNTHRVRNTEIQRLVRRISIFHDKAIHDRLLELGVNDFVWDGITPTFYRMMNIPNPSVESHCTITFDCGS